MGIVQGLTEFLPISSSGHLILVPYLLGWDDPFIESLAFSVVLHAGTLAALLVYFRDDWLRLVPAGLATHPRPLVPGRPGPPARVAASPWPRSRRSSPALLFNDVIEDAFRQAGLVALTLVVGGVILWLADRCGPAHAAGSTSLTFRGAIGIGVAQALALIPGVSRSGISISAGAVRRPRPRGRGPVRVPDGDADHRAGASRTRALKLVRGEVASAPSSRRWSSGIVAAFVSGHPRDRRPAALPPDAVVRRSSSSYRFVLAAIVLVVVLVCGVGAGRRWRS